MSAAQHDLVVRGALVLDGSGGAGFEADVAVDGDRITIVGESPGTGREELDGRGLVLAPGFIDPHTHLDANLFWDPDVTPSRRYGVTTVVTGNCGYALAPIADDRRARLRRRRAVHRRADRPRRGRRSVSFAGRHQADYFECSIRLPVLCNFATLVGHVPVRTAVLGPDAAHEREATADEVAPHRRARRRRPAPRCARLLHRPGRGQLRPRRRRAPRAGVRRRRAARRRRTHSATVRGRGCSPWRPACLDPGARRARSRSRLARAARGGERQAGGGRARVRPVVGSRRRVRPARAHRVRGPAPERAGRAADLDAGLRAVDPTRHARRCSCASLPTLHAAVDSRGRPQACAVSPTDEAGPAPTRPRKPTTSVPTLVWSGKWEHVAVRWSPTRPRSLRSQRPRPRDGSGTSIPSTCSSTSPLGDDFETQFATEHGERRRRPARATGRAPGGDDRGVGRGRARAVEHRLAVTRSGRCSTGSANAGC